MSFNPDPSLPPDGFAGDPGSTTSAHTQNFSFLHAFGEMLEILLLALILFVVINFVSSRIRVNGFSMEPTLNDGSLVLVNKLAYRLGQPARGDVIVFYYPRNPTEEYIKRLIGLPGDLIRIQDGKVYVNDELTYEPYISASPQYDGSWQVPSGNFFVLGDNRNNSSDSHDWGMLPIEYVVGKALVVYWPIDSLQILNMAPSVAVKPVVQPASGVFPYPISTPLTATAPTPYP